MKRERRERLRTALCWTGRKEAKKITQKWGWGLSLGWPDTPSLRNENAAWREEKIKTCSPTETKKNLFSLNLLLPSWPPLLGRRGPLFLSYRFENMFRSPTGTQRPQTTKILLERDAEGTKTIDIESTNPVHQPAKPEVKKKPLSNSPPSGCPDCQPSTTAAVISNLQICYSFLFMSIDPPVCFTVKFGTKAW